MYIYVCEKMQAYTCISWLCFKIDFQRKSRDSNISVLTNMCSLQFVLCTL